MSSNILFVATECAPFVKTGGLGDVIGALPQSLKETGGLDVRVFLPLYDEIDAKWKDQMEFVQYFDVPLGWRIQDASLYTLEHNGVIYYFIGNDYYFTRKGIYGYFDDGERFVYYCHAVMEALNVIDFIPDVLHAHDWQSAVAVALAKIVKPIPDLKTVLTIHNLKYQGVMPLDTFHNFFRLSSEHIGGFEWNGNLNCLKAGLFHADKITTVSPSYAEEIKDPYFGEGLETILQQRADDLVGIINGIDTKEYNPLTDPYIEINYRSARSKKKDNKVLLQQALGLPTDPDIPLYIIISRMVEQKGFHLVQHILDEFLQENIQLIVLGTGEEEFEQSFTWFSDKYPEKMKTLIKFDEGLARKMYAASDFFIMPSKFEPCGLSQLIALQYKSVPIVRETGGLKDTVKPFNEYTGEGNGFSFKNYNAHELLYILRYSLSVYHHPQKWQQLSRNVNKSTFSWKESAREYAQLYEQLVPIRIK